MTKEEFEQLLGSSILGAVFSSSCDGYAYTDERGSILYCNRAYHQITGLPEGEISGHSVYDLVKKGFPVSAMTIQVMETRQSLTEVIRYSRFSNHEVLVTMVPVYDTNTGAFLGTISNFRDLTSLNDIRASLQLIDLRYQETLYQSETMNARLLKKIHSMEIDPDVLNVVGESKAARDLMELARRIAHVDSTVLITGESGVGKDVFCQMVQYFSGGDDYIKVSCGAIPENLLESELFGYEAGAFTGASRHGKQGIFELARSGIVFLDEIGEMPLQLQVKLLTVLQDRKYFRVGGTKEILLRARIMAATNRDLKQMVEEGTFRKDLYYRLNVIPVFIPPLRQRREDIIPLADRCLSRLNEKNSTHKVFSVDVQSLLKRYSWPGNIRELNNMVERMYVMTLGDVIDTSVCPEELCSLIHARDVLRLANRKGTLKESMEAVEAMLIEQSLKKEAPLTEIAAELGIGIATLERKISKYHLRKKRFHGG